MTDEHVAGDEPPKTKEANGSVKSPGSVIVQPGEKMRVIAPGRIFRSITALSVFGVPMVLLLYRPGAPLAAALCGLAGLAGSSYWLRSVSGSGPLGGHVATAALLSFGLWTTIIGYFFGPNSTYAAFVALALAVTGALGGGGSTLNRWRGRFTFMSVALGQVLLFFAIASELLPDRSLTRVLIPGHRGWHHLLAHGVLQLFYLGAYTIGHVLQKRFARLLRQLHTEVHQAAEHEALVRQARTEYRRALSGDRSRPNTPKALEHDREHDRETLTLQGERSENEGSLVRQRLDRGQLKEVVIAALKVLVPLHARGLTHMAVQPSSFKSSGAAWNLGYGTGTSPSDPEVVVYLAPECLRGSAPNPTQDTYGLAACLYSATTGCAPFMDVLPPDRAQAVLTRMPLAPNSLVDLPEALQTVLAIGLAKDPGQRFPSLDAFCSAFLLALNGQLDSDTKVRLKALALPWHSAPSSPGPETRPSKEQEGGGVKHETQEEREETASASAIDQEWRMAYATKMRVFRWSLLIACTTGAVLLGTVGREPGPLTLALVCLFGMMTVGFLADRVQGYWPWSLIGALFVGPAYSLGLHSAIVAALPIALFAGGYFQRQPRENGVRDPRRRVFIAVVGAHSAAVLAVATGWLPDAGNVALVQPGASIVDVMLVQFLLIVVLVAAFSSGRIIEGRQERIAERRRQLARETGRQEVLLRAARSQLDLATAHNEGIFIGHQIGRYAVNALIARGGMGEVYDASDVHTGQRIALKVVRADRITEPSFIEHLRAEATALSQVDSPNVARVLGFSLSGTSIPHLAMQFIDGPSLDVCVKRKPFSLEETCALVGEIARGLEDMHHCGLVHCDVKPRNVLKPDHGGWTLVDLGVSRWICNEESSSRSAGGTPGYMAPEQALRGQVDPRSDVFSLASVAYFALMGHPPFSGDDPAALALQAIERGPPRPSIVLPDSVLTVLRLGLAASPEQRVATPLLFATLLETACAGKISDELTTAAERLGWSPSGGADTPPMST